MMRGPIPKDSMAPRISLAAPDMPPMGLAMERLEAGSKTRRYRSTANSVFLVTEGAGVSMIGGRRFAWQRGDTFVAPSWTWIEHARHARQHTVHAHRRAVDAVLRVLPFRSRVARMERQRDAGAASPPAPPRIAPSRAARWLHPGYQPYAASVERRRSGSRISSLCWPSAGSRKSGIAGSSAKRMTGAM